MAESTSKKETMMRLKDLRGAHEWIGAEAWMRSLMVWRLSARKISESWRLVMRRVFEGGVGCCRGGREERSIDIGVRDPFDETGREVGGEEGELSVVILVVDRGFPRDSRGGSAGGGVLRRKLLRRWQLFGGWSNGGGDVGL